MDQTMFDGSNLGLERKAVRLSPSDPTWAATFDGIVPKLKTALTDAALAIEHVGSTAVPGLSAKPILDIAVGLRPDIEKETVAGRLEALGFIYRGESEEDDGLNLMFGWEDSPRHRIVNLHAVTYNGPRWREYVVFRDRLRADSKARDAYAKLKQDLAREFPNDRNAYIAGKITFIAQILADR
jgi:GrpB-like predicted nucleotidyltransferase (UPF0157 family)